MERSSELEQLVRDWFANASRGDTSLVHERVSPHDGARFIRPEPGDVLKGGGAVAQVLKGEVDGAGGNVEFTPTDVEAFSEGTVGWATTSLTLTLPDGKRVAPRWSAVFHREESAWKFVQIHASFGIASADIVWLAPG